MAQRAARGSIFPVMVTAAIAFILGTWALYAFSGAGLVRRLPLLRLVLVLIAVVYLARGTLGIPVGLLIDDPYIRELRDRMTFRIVSSAISTVIGLCYALGAARPGRPLLD